MSKHFYITTTLPYVNAEPHIGFAFELVSADIIARYEKLLGYEVFFNTGTDEHGTKVWEKAKEEGKDPQAYTDAYAEKFKGLKEPLGLLPEINFIRTTDKHHVAAAQEFWRRCKASGDIYKKNYRVKYCVGCELEKTDSELVDGRCAVHPHLEPQVIEEENYFFRLSNYQQKLLNLYDENPDFVIPAFRLNEVRSLIKEKGLEDFSISRLKSKMPWGVSVPDDEEHVMYVWFDALVNYISAIGWPDDMKTFEKWWPVVQFAGKDQVRQQAVMWQAMLMSASIAPSRQIVIHGFIQSGGQKMSKSLGNVIDPLKLVEEYGTDALRFYLARHIHPFEDSDFTMEKFKEAYNADLANGLGNLVSRVMKMYVSFFDEPITLPTREYVLEMCNDGWESLWKPMEDYRLDVFLEQLWASIGKGFDEGEDVNKSKSIGTLDWFIQTTEPFKKIKTHPAEAKKHIWYLIHWLWYISIELEPIMPQTAETIQKLILEHNMPEKPLFPRK